MDDEGWMVTDRIGHGWDDFIERVKSGEYGDRNLKTIWPELDDAANLNWHYTTSFVARRGTHEATIGRQLAMHFAQTMPVLLVSSYPPSNSPEKLHVYTPATPTPEQIDAELRRLQNQFNAEKLGLVVVERIERLKLYERPEDMTRVEELEDCMQQLRQLRGEGHRECPLILTTVTDETPDFRRRVVHWAGVDSPAGILTDYSTRVIALDRVDEDTVTAQVDVDSIESGMQWKRFPIAWKLPPGARRIFAEPTTEQKPAPTPAPVRAVAVPKAEPQGTIQALETEYAGHLFRSRLEARWAVFFDALGIPWDYEAERYQLPSGKYLPDFWLPRQECFFEVKGRQPSSAYMGLLEELAEGTGHRVVMAVGSIPNPERIVVTGPDDDFWIETAESDGDETTWERWQAWCYCPECGAFDVTFDGIPATAYCQHGITGSTANAEQVVAAYRAARSARFEHGESGRTL